MGGSSDYQYTKTQSEIDLENKQIELLDLQIADAKKPVTVPEVQKVLPIAPSPTESSADVAAAEQAARNKAARRTNSARGTLFAGETSGYNGSTLGGKKSLLG